MIWILLAWALVSLPVGILIGRMCRRGRGPVPYPRHPEIGP